MVINRRTFVLFGAASLTAACTSRAHADEAAPALAPEQKFEVMHTDAEWRQLLTKTEYSILRREDTEFPGTSPLLKEHRKGTFVCAGCGLDVFSSETKFESGTGWPSFWAPIERGVGTKVDMSLDEMRTAVFCRRCGGHLGHLFSDGPKPTGLRYCINGGALKFRAE